MEYYEVLLPLALLLALSKVFMKICARVRIPSVVGMLLAGITVGLIQYIPGQEILNETAFTGLSFFAKIGVILIMFSAGIETDLNQIKKIGGPAFVITISGVICPMALGFLVSVLFNGGFGALTTQTLFESIFYGTILTATSVSVTVATLREAGKLNSKVGTSIIAAAIIDDIIGIIVLSFVLAVRGGSGVKNPWIVLIMTILYFIVAALISIIAKKFFMWLDSKFPHHRLIPIMSIAFCFAFAYVSERVFGIADITGAYIVGLILSTNPDSSYIVRKSDVMSYMLFVPVFFGNIGISTRFDAIDGKMLLFGFLFILAGIFGKLFGCGTASLACGYSLSDSYKVGLGMMARAEVALVTAQKGVEHGIIDSSIMPFIVLLILITSFITPILIQAEYRREEKKTLSNFSIEHPRAS
jgi:Kef-type K+ transport system membrane component KefB